jgi:hypothetical protein
MSSSIFQPKPGSTSQTSGSIFRPAPTGTQTDSYIKQNWSLPGVKPLGKYDDGFKIGFSEMGQDPAMLQEWNRSAQQGVFSKYWNGFRSRGMSIAPKIGKGLGHVLGFAASPFTEDGIETAFSNTMTEAFQKMDDNLRELYPVYKSRRYTEGNFWQQVGTAEW